MNGQHRALSVEWGDIESYYTDDAEIARKREAWADSAASWESERDEAVSAAERGDVAQAAAHLRTMRRIEGEWGDDSATREVADALGIAR